MLSRVLLRKQISVVCREFSLSLTSREISSWALWLSASSFPSVLQPLSVTFCAFDCWVLAVLARVPRPENIDPVPKSHGQTCPIVLSWKSSHFSSIFFLQIASILDLLMAFCMEQCKVPVSDQGAVGWECQSRIRVENIYFLIWEGDFLTTWRICRNSTWIYFFISE